MLVLGIETSCDETAVSIVENGRRIRSNVISSSLSFHRRYRGVIPEIASRLQLDTIDTVFAEALKQARVRLRDIKLIAVTSYPGLAGSLRVGICFARALSFAQRIPLVAVDHLHAHVYAGFFNKHKPDFPFVGLVVSGGHTSLYYVKGCTKFKLLGWTQDDACGEAFDKVATILGLGYPGGPLIERLARHGDAKKVRFRCSNTENPLNFSFSGIKTAVLYKVRGDKSMGKDGIADVAASFQEAVIDALIEKSYLACRLKNTKRLVIGGGVAANNRLREKFVESAGINNLDIYFSPTEFCTDNATMVAGLGYWLSKGVRG